VTAGKGTALFGRQTSSNQWQKPAVDHYVVKEMHYALKVTQRK
jgi:hypothetical protein